MSENNETCSFVAQQEDPSTWHGERPEEWLLEESTWNCPHQALKGGKFCVFHIHPDELPPDLNEADELLQVLDTQIKSPNGDTDQQNTHFIGAQFGRFELRDETIDAAADDPLVLCHSLFHDHVIIHNCTFEGELDLMGTRFDSEVVITDTTFRGDGDVTFRRADFGGEGRVKLSGAVFENSGTVSFEEVEFNNREGEETITKEYKDEVEIEVIGDVILKLDANVSFENVIFSNGGLVDFSDVKFKNEGFVSFEEATFENRGDLSFHRIVVENHDEVRFGDVQFDNRGAVRFNSSKFDNGGDVTFDETRFSNAGYLGFKGAVFSNQGTVSFRNVEFHPKDFLDFREVRFYETGDLLFDEAKIVPDGNARFRRARFDNGADVNFNNTIFNSESVDFRVARFSNEGAVRFVSTKFLGSGYVDFIGIEMVSAGSTNFFDTKFRNDGDVWFKRTAFDNGEFVSFEKVDFDNGGAVEFDDADFGMTKHWTVPSNDQDRLLVTFKSARFTNDRATTFNRIKAATVELDFEEVQFEGYVRFLKAKFRPSTSFASTDFSGIDLQDFAPRPGMSFAKANFTGVDLSDVNFRGANLEQAIFSRADLTEVDFTGSRFDGALFGDAHINYSTNFGHLDLHCEIRRDFRVVYDRNAVSSSRVDRWFISPIKRYLLPRSLWLNEHHESAIEGDTDEAEGRIHDDAHSADQRLAQMRTAAGTYQTLESIGRTHALPELQTKSFVRRQEMNRLRHAEEASRDSSSSKWGRYARSSAARIIMLYGESPWRVISFGAVVIFGFAVIYPLGDWLIPLGGGTSNDEYLRYTADGVEAFFQSLYFSVVTFTTLGFGDFKPEGWGRMFAMINTSLGALLFALLVWVLGRRAAR